MTLTTSTGRFEHDMGDLLVPYNSHKSLDFISDFIVDVQGLVWYAMIYDKLLKLKDELGKKVLRDPRTAGELLVRKNYGRVMEILWKRYEYGIDDMEEYRWGDFRDEIATINLRR